MTITHVGVPNFETTPNHPKPLFASTSMSADQLDWLEVDQDIGAPPKKTAKMEDMNGIFLPIN